MQWFWSPRKLSLSLFPFFPHLFAVPGFSISELCYLLVSSHWKPRALSTFGYFECLTHLYLVLLPELDLQEDLRPHSPALLFLGVTVSSWVSVPLPYDQYCFTVSSPHEFIHTVHQGLGYLPPGSIRIVTNLSNQNALQHKLLTPWPYSILFPYPFPDQFLSENPG